MIDLQSLANVSEIIGNIVVLLSLIYLAIQVRQNTEGQRTENYARALERLAAMQSMQSQDSDTSLILSRGILDPAKLSPQERIRFTWIMFEAFGAYEFMFHASKTDSIPEEIWWRWSMALAWWVSFPGVKTWWKAVPVPFTGSFTSFVESLMENNPSDAEATRRWRDFIAK